MGHVAKIVSGGQTGADRAGLAAAQDLDLPRGGTAPQDWLAEDGTIPPVYRDGMTEHSSSDYQRRTYVNVRDADVTVIFVGAARSPGSALTARFCRELERPFVRLIFPPGVADNRKALRDFLLRQEKDALVLNVAGSRESRAPGIFAYVRAVLVDVIGAMNEART